jgi:hypothetical protein
MISPGPLYFYLKNRAVVQAAPVKIDRTESLSPFYPLQDYILPPSVAVLFLKKRRPGGAFNT